MIGNAALAGVGPSAVRELNRVPLVASLQTLAVTAVGPQGKPQRVIKGAGTNVGLDLGTPGLAVGANPMETVREQVAPFPAEHDDGGKPITLVEISCVVVDHLGVDGDAHLRARVEDEAVERQRLANGNASRQLRRNARRVTTGVS